MTESELVEWANSILAELNLSLLTPTEERILWCKPHDTEVDVYNSLSEILNKRGAAGNDVERLNYYAKFHGVDVDLKKKIPNNVFLGCGL